MSGYDLSPERRYRAILRLGQRWGMTLQQIIEYIDSIGLELEMVLYGYLLGDSTEVADD